MMFSVRKLSGREDKFDELLAKAVDCRRPAGSVIGHIALQNSWRL